MRIVLALISLLVGLALLVSGYRFARFLIPLLGFIAGLSVGGAIIADMNATPFLGTVLGVIVGLVLGLILATVAYLYYYAAVVILGAAVGYWLGSSFMFLLGLNPGLISATIGVLVGAAVGLAVVVFNAPKYVLILLTSLAAAVITVGGVMLLFNQIPLDAYSFSAVGVTIRNSFVWTLITLALWATSIVIQTIMVGPYELEHWSLNEDGEPSGGNPRLSHR